MLTPFFYVKQAVKLHYIKQNRLAAKTVDFLYFMWYNIRKGFAFVLASIIYRNIISQFFMPYLLAYCHKINSEVLPLWQI